MAYTLMEKPWPNKNEDFKALEPTHFVQMRGGPPNLYRPAGDDLVGEDMRLLRLKNDTMMAMWASHFDDKEALYHFSEIKLEIDPKTGNKVLFIENGFGNQVAINHEKTFRTVKNWPMFEYGNGTILFVERIQPLRIVIAAPRNPGGNYWLSHTVSLSVMTNFCWNYGEVRGGTPALLVGDEYMGFFHSNRGYQGALMNTYWLGFYSFSSKPPFVLTRFSKFPIVSKEMGEGWTYRFSMDYCIFPVSFRFDEDYIYVSYGKNEKEGWVVKLDRKKLLANAVKAESVVLGESLWNDDVPVFESFALHNDAEVHCTATKTCHEI